MEGFEGHWCLELVPMWSHPHPNPLPKGEGDLAILLPVQFGAIGHSPASAILDCRAWPWLWDKPPRYIFFFRYRL